ncbi:MAG: GTPase HflX [Pseudomonadota bacterium]
MSDHSEQDDKARSRQGKPRFQIEDTRARQTRTCIIVPILSARSKPGTTRASGQAATLERSADARVQEAVGLAAAINLDVVFQRVVQLQNLRPATLLGRGKVDEIAEHVRADSIELVFVDHELTPIQQRNLERALHAKVLDRTGLILEIFGRRAQTREGTLQVELAHLSYQKSRLVRSWTHLERQRGGKGFLGGPGETQIEADRRVIQTKITRLQKQIEDVRRMRTLHRARRQSVPAPTVALVGYTNAGKSTLFNRLAGSDVMAEDLLFATLDPTLRRVTLPRGTEIVLSDTVGFISDLPTSLIAAFRATLEEVQEADLIVHVRDMTDPDNEVQKADVLSVLKQLEIGPDDAGVAPPMIEAWNKIDTIGKDERDTLFRTAERLGDTIIPVSAITGEGVSLLEDVMEAAITASRNEAEFHLKPSDGEGRAWLFRHATILKEELLEDGSCRMRVALTARDLAHARERFQR